MANERTQYRCAVYTRKSSEEGLDQDFNSLQAQREACEAFIISQRGEGWKLIPTAYDDGGLSGGNMERPALRRLLADITAGGVDIIVVYKVDRLTRSLADFAKMVEVFDAQGVSFVAVTQQFNTTTSMGRLTLNVLLSFAQFEREVTGERIRDKIAASKKKGMWMGGPVPLGYEVKERKLVIVPHEAERVRHIYIRYLALPGVMDLRAELRANGIRSKRRTEAGDNDFSRGALYALLGNPLYVGKVSHKGSVFAGQHESIVDEAQWMAVQEKLKSNAARKGTRNRVTAPSPLMGKLFDEAGQRLIASHAVARGRRYRYYISPVSDVEPRTQKLGWRLPAKEIEKRVESMVEEMLGDRGHIVRVALEAGVREADIGQLLISVEENSAWADLIECVELGPEIKVRVVIPFDPPVALQRAFPVTIKRRGSEMRLVVHGERRGPALPVDASLVKAIGRAMRWWEDLKSGVAKSAREIAEREGMKERFVQRYLPLATLAPDIVENIAAGQQPVELTTKVISLDVDIPISWGEQKKTMGF